MTTNDTLLANQSMPKPESVLGEPANCAAEPKENLAGPSRGDAKPEDSLGGLIRQNAELKDALDALVRQNAELGESLNSLVRKNAELEAAVQERKSNDAQKKYKDRVFRFLFGNPQKKEWTLSLYNAVNGTDYKNPEDISFNTIGDAVYLGMRNDVSFIVSFEMNLWEHQSTFNPNMPMRYFFYAASLYEKYVAASDYYPYSSTVQKIPRPKCVCFYNGTRKQPQEMRLALSDAYEGDGDIEVIVTMYNINYGMNPGMMEACKPLAEYSWLVDKVREKQKTVSDLETAIDAALDEMPQDFVIRGFLLGNRAEVKGMFLTEYDEEKVRRMEREEGKLEGILEEAERKNAIIKQKDEELEQKEKELGRKDEELEQKEKELGRKDEELEQKEKELGQKNEELEQKEKELGQKDEELEQKEKELGQKDEELARKDRELQNKEAALKGRNEDVAKRMLRDGIRDASCISRISTLPVDTIRSLAQTMGIGLEQPV